LRTAIGHGLHPADPHDDESRATELFFDDLEIPARRWSATKARASAI